MLCTGEIQHMKPIFKNTSLSYVREAPLHHPVEFSSLVKILDFVFSWFLSLVKILDLVFLSSWGSIFLTQAFHPFSCRKNRSKQQQNSGQINFEIWRNTFATFGQIYFFLQLPISSQSLSCCFISLVLSTTNLSGLPENKQLNICEKLASNDTLTIIRWVSLWVIAKMSQHRCNLCHICHHIVRYTPNPPKNYVPCCSSTNDWGAYFESASRLTGLITWSEERSTWNQFKMTHLLFCS